MSRIRAGVIGWPIAHSKSPLLHGYWLRRYGVDGSYEAVEAPPGALAETLARLAAEGWAGVNVTIPHKEEVLTLADTVSARARRIGAANTLVFRTGGGFSADNTDSFGFIENLRETLGGNWRPSGPALLIGAGGASRAVLNALDEIGVDEVRLINRTRARADRIVAEMKLPANVFDWADLDRAVTGCALIVNATSLGMSGQPPLEIDLGRAAPGAVATDIVYNPLVTPFLSAAAKAGLTTVDGLGMLIHQARPGFEAWFGVAPTPDHALRERLLQS